MRPRTLPLLLLSALSVCAREHSDLSSTTSSATTARHTSSTSIQPAQTSIVTECKTSVWPTDPWAAFRDATDEDCTAPGASTEPSEGDTKPIPVESPATSSTTSTTVEPTPPADTFVSFEEWKKIKQAEEEEHENGKDERPEDDNPSHDQGLESNSTGNQTQSSTEVTGDQAGMNGSSSQPKVSQAATSQSNSKVEVSISTSQGSTQQPSPSPPPSHHSRYNYASPDCSARIHSSSPQTQHASSLLHKSRDRYMLTPCKAKEHWVVVELCDEIRIEAVEVAVWEFFSGVVREVRVSVGGEDDEDYEDDPDDGVNGRSPKWKEVGSFVGKNVRGVQTFTLSQPTSFHRFIRLDFPSYFGTEYYCPVSQLKVYGMNQMEAFKWEQKRSSAAAKEKEKAGNKDKDKDRERDKEAEERKAREQEAREKKERDEKEKQQLREKELDELEKLLHEQAGRVVPDILTETILSKIEETVSTSSTHKSVIASSPSSKSRVSKDVNSPPWATSEATTSTGHSSISAAAQNQSDKSDTTNVSSSQAVTSSISKPQTTATTSKATTDAPPPPASSSTYSRSPTPKSDSSESIYAFIIRRLNALEGNSTLVARYIEEQAKVMRHMLTRVERGWDDWKGEWEGEDRGRWEQERMRQEDRLGKIISQFEQQRVAMEAERKEILTQLRVLADELGYERRRGLAQLFIMFFIIVLGVVTRSSTIDAVLKPLLAEAKRRRSMRKSFSGPLTGLRIDMGVGRPPAVIGQKRPMRSDNDGESQVARDRDRDRDRNREDHGDRDRDRGARFSEDVLALSPTSPSLTPQSRHRTGGGKNPTSRRPGTPNTLRQRRLPPSVLTSNLRSVSTSDAVPVSPSISGSGPSSLTSPKPRGSLPLSTRPGGAPRKLARSAHLHTMEADRVRHDLKKSHHRSSSLTDSVIGLNGLDGGDGTPKRPRSNLRPPDVVDLSHSPDGSNEVSPFTVPQAVGDSDWRLPDAHPVDDGPSDWGTDMETEMSASEVEDEVESTDRGGKGTSSQEAVVRELKDIWNGDK